MKTMTRSKATEAEEMRSPPPPPPYDDDDDDNDVLLCAGFLKACMVGVGLSIFTRRRK